MTEPNNLHGLIYDTALRPELWPELLDQLAGLFRCHFADVFARTQNWSEYHGLAHGLDAADYQEQFLDTWTTRNVWSQRHPARLSGEIITTDQIITRADMLRSEMYNEYLRERDLDQGLRLTTWSGEGWINDISLIRSFSTGSFDARERRMAGALLPHLERSAAIARQVATRASDQADAMLMLERLDQPALLVDRSGRVLRANHLGEQIVAKGDGIAILGNVVLAGTPAHTSQLLEAIGSATISRHRRAGALMLPRPGNNAPLSVRVVPVTARLLWPVPDAGAALLLVDRRATSNGQPIEQLRADFNLTAAETEIARHLAAGMSVAELAAATERSIHTVRTHVANLLQKTHSRRQGDLMRLLLTLGGAE